MTTRSAATAVAAPDAHLPLVVTSDDGLLDDLLRLAAAGGIEVQVAPNPDAARGRYAAAPLVVLGADQAPACLRLPRRPDLVIAARASGTVDPWEFARPLGVTQVATLPAAEAWLVDRLAGCRQRSAPARVVAVLCGRGGAGASVLAAGLALAAATAGRRVLLVDADPLGGGLDLVLGREGDQGLGCPELTATGGRLDGPALVGRGDLALLSFDRRAPGGDPPEVMAGVLAAGRHARDLVVVDTPRYLDDAATVALQTADEVLLVVPAEKLAAAAAAKVAALVGEHCPRVRLVVRGLSPGGLTAEELGRSLRLPVAGMLRPEQVLPPTLEGGRASPAAGRGPLAILCRRLADELCAGAEDAERFDSPPHQDGVEQ